MKKILPYLTIFTLIFLIFSNNEIVLSSTIEASNIWFYKVFPYLFIMLIVNDFLININIIKYFKNNIIYIFIMSLISGTPSSAYIIGNLYNNKAIPQKSANISLLFTYFSNPLFLYTILNNIFLNRYQSIKIILIHYLSNMILFLLNRNKLINNSSCYKTSHFNIAESIKKAINTNLLVLGSICFYLIISNIIINIFSFNQPLSIFIKGLLEITQGLNDLINYKFNYKELIAIIIISFGGLSIHTQVKCLLDEYNLNYKYFFLGRIIQTIIAIIILFIVNHL